jgi:citrate lyase subunit beta/citryl-CoA lyase
MDGPPRLRRSLLFVPGADARKLERARGSDADTLLFDLEDSVAPGQKAEARVLVAEALRGSGFGEVELAVRVNPVQTPWFEEDVEAVIGAGGRCLMLPKAQSVEGVAEAMRSIEAAERRQEVPYADAVRLLALIETPAGIIHAAEVGASSHRIEALCFGHADFSLEMGLTEPDPSRGSVLHARCQLAIAAKAVGVIPIDNIFPAVRDEQAFHADTELGRELGFEGKLCIHPAQVPIANQIYTPGPEQIERAQAIVEGWKRALEEGRGVFTIDNKMVDAPLAAVQERLLERARRAGKL